MAHSAQLPARLWTLGHSTLPLEDFLGLLGRHGIEAIADVRRFPGSRRHPHFAQDALRASLLAADIEYCWLPSLGGRRRPRPDSPHTAWRNDSFRGYADYMDTPEFDEGLQVLLELASRRRTAVMCAEALWWRCHRGLIADLLQVRGVSVCHIQSQGGVLPHPYTSAATVVDGRLSYAATPVGPAS